MRAHWTLHISIIATIALALLFKAQYVQGINCYTCVEASNTPESDTCSYVLSEGKYTKCPASDSICLHVTGIVNGENMEYRTCGHSGWTLLVGGSNKCRESDNILKFTSSLMSKNELHFQNGTICICDSENCNPAGKMEPIFAVTILTGLVVRLLAY